MLYSCYSHAMLDSVVESSDGCSDTVRIATTAVPVQFLCAVFKLFQVFFNTFSITFQRLLTGIISTVELLYKRHLVARNQLQLQLLWLRATWLRHGTW